MYNPIRLGEILENRETLELSFMKQITILLIKLFI